MTEDAALPRFLALCEQPFARLQLTQATSADGAQRLQLRPIELRGAPHWQAVWRHPTKDLTENWPAADGPRRLAGLLQAPQFQAAGLWTAQAHWQLDRSRKGAWRLVRHRSEIAPPTPVGHDREKLRPLVLGHPVWVALGLAQGVASGGSGGGGEAQLVPAMAKKWKQINRFVEIFDGALRQAELTSDQPLRVADFGCGRGYLTFAMALQLAARGRQAEVLGVELRADLVAQTESLARQWQVKGLHFAQGDVGAREVKPLDVMVALHACDTATDHAIHHGLRAGAALIICAPCCHKQLRGQLQPPSALRPLFKHGIHLGQEAEMLTDGLRALWLESQGYETQVFEFVSTEHTQKNKMILALRRAQWSPKRRAEALEQAQALKEFWGVGHHMLQQLLDA